MRSRVSSSVWLRAISVAVVVSLAVGIAACKPKSSGDLVLAVNKDVGANLDPTSSVVLADGVAFTQIYDRLVSYHPDGSLVPHLAKSWSVSDDGCVYTFNLRNDVHFHDGTPFDAAAVKFNFDRIMDPGFPAVRKATMGPYDKCVVTDKYTLEVHFTEPYAAFLGMLAYPERGIVSPTAVQKYGADFGAHPVGTGPFVFVKWVPDSYVLLARNEDYNWPPKGVFASDEGPAKVSTLKILAVPESTARDGVLDSGEAHMTYSISGAAIKRFDANPQRYRVVIEDTARGALGIHFNLEKAPANDKSVRIALQYAVDQVEMVQTLRGRLNKGATGPVGPSYAPYYYPEYDDVYPFSPVQAGRVLDEAGWLLRSDGFRYKDGKKLSLTCVVNDSEEFVQYTEWVEARAREVGIEIKLDVMGDQARREAGEKGTYHMVVRGFADLKDPHSMYNDWHSSQIGLQNYWRGTGPLAEQLDDLLERGAAEADPAARVEIYREVIGIVATEVIWLPLRFVTSQTAMLTTVEGFMLDGTRAFPLLNDVRIRKD